MDDVSLPVKTLSAEEKAFRKRQVAYGRGTVRLEGFHLSEEFEALNQRYIAGDITFEEHGAAVARLNAQ